jgi:hypothetical protein
MPSASEYTSFVKLTAATTAYANGNIPRSNQNTMQPVPLVSILNAQTIASSIGATVGRTNVVSFGTSRVVRYTPGTTNQPKSFSTISHVGGHQSSKFRKT